MANTEIPSSGKDFDEGLGLASVSVAALSNLLSKLRANPSDEANWTLAHEILGRMALGLEEMGQGIVDNTNSIERLINHLKLRD